MNIRTTPDNTGFAPSDCVWQAVDDDTYDYDGPIGLGATEEEAIDDLLVQLEEHGCPRCDAPRDERPDGCRDPACPEAA